MPAQPTEAQKELAVATLRQQLNQIEAVVMGWVVGPMLTDAQQDAIVDAIGTIEDTLDAATGTRG